MWRPADGAGIGKAEGATYAYMRDYFEGFFMAPHTTGDAIKGAIFEAALLEKMGLDVSPKWDEPRTDIVQKVIFGETRADDQVLWGHSAPFRSERLC